MNKCNSAQTKQWQDLQWVLKNSKMKKLPTATEEIIFHHDTLNVTRRSIKARDDFSKTERPYFGNANSNQKFGVNSIKS